MSTNLAKTLLAEVRAAQADEMDPVQYATVRAVVLHLEEHGAAALAKAGHPVHLTASCFVFDDSLEETLLSFHRKGQFWVQLGGHIETDDLSLRQAALREFQEESGITAGVWLSALPLDADIHDVSSAFGACRTHLDLAFGAVVPRGTVTAASEESDTLGWHPADGLPPDSVTGLAERAARIRRRILLELLRPDSDGSAS